MSAVLITGGSGFFGGILKARLLAEGFDCVNVDLEPDPARHPALVSVQGDIRDTALLERLFDEYRFTAVFHCAAVLAHDIRRHGSLWTSNVAGTTGIAQLATRHDVQKI